MDIWNCGFQIHEDVHIAIGTLFPASEGPDDSDAAYMVLPKEAIPVLAQIRDYFRWSGSSVGCGAAVWTHMEDCSRKPKFVEMGPMPPGPRSTSLSLRQPRSVGDRLLLRRTCS
jgi:hypothetical protein